MTTLLLAITVLLGCGAGHRGAPPGREFPLLPEAFLNDSTIVRDPQAEVYCSQEKLRTGVVRLSWSSEQSHFVTQRLELTAYKDGFAKGTAVTLDLREGKTLQLSAAAQRDKTLKPLSNLHILQTRFDPTTKRVVVEIEGIEPGITYFWRVVTGSDQGEITETPLRFEAPTCPADIEPDR
jgi:hypothetical protein